MRRLLWVAVGLGILGLSLSPALWAVSTPASSTPTATFPLPGKHSEIAAKAENMETGQTACPKSVLPVILIRFNLQGYHWLVAIAGDTTRYLFIQYPADNHDRPIRVFVGVGSDDPIHIIRVVEDPMTTEPAGPCMLLYPEKT